MMFTTKIMALGTMLVLSLTLGGCVQRPWLDTSAKQLDVGHHHEVDVERLLGEPHGVVVLDTSSRCAERWAYSDDRRDHAQRRPRVLFVDFDRSGVVCDYALGHMAD